MYVVAFTKHIDLCGVEMKVLKQFFNM